MRLTSKFGGKRKGRCVQGIDIIGTTGIHGHGTIVKSSSITQIRYFMGTPRTAFGITHANTAFLIVPTRPFQTFVTIEFVIGRTGRFIKQSVNVIVGNTALIASGTGKGRDTGTGIDNDSLTLRRCPTPQIRIMCTVSLKQSGNLIGGYRVGFVQGSILTTTTIVFVFGMLAQCFFPGR